MDKLFNIGDRVSWRDNFDVPRTGTIYDIATYEYGKYARIEMEHGIKTTVDFCDLFILCT